MRALAIQRILGALLGMASLIMLPPLAFAWFNSDGAERAFLSSFVVMAAGGLLMWFPARRARYELRIRDGFLVTALSWLMISFVAALPFWLGPPHLDLPRAVFESVSGITTTGATVMTAIDSLPISVKFYRQMLNFVGGMGIIVLAVAILPMLKIGGMQLMGAEKAGVSKDTKLTPRIAETAKTLWVIYIALTASCALAYWLAGMDLFNAVGHSFSTVATAGFSTHDASIGYYDSPLIEAIAVTFMLVGAVNFAMHFYAWRHATSAHYYRDTELKVMLGVALVVSLITGAGLWLAGTYADTVTGFRHAVFHTVSHLTSTGFGTTGFFDWPAHLALMMILVAFVGGCAGSTAGGLKVIRIIVLVKQGMLEMVRLIHPKAQLSLKVGRATVPILVSSAVLAYFTLFIVCLALFTAVIAAFGHDLVTAASAAASCLLNLGPALAIAGPHYNDMADGALWVLGFAMLLGRLELFTLLVLLTPAFWRS